MPPVLCRVFGATALFLCAVAAPLSAQGDLPMDLVPRIGVTLGPPQFTFGVELPMAGVADITFLVFAPSLDIGVGDNRTTIRANANLGYAVPTSNPNTRIFPLIGLGAAYQSLGTNGDDEGVDTSDAGFGVNIGAGAQVGALVVEGLFGLGNIPDFAVTVGYSVAL